MKLRANEEVQRFKVVNFIFHLFVVTVMVRDCTQAHLCGGFRGRGRFFFPLFLHIAWHCQVFLQLTFKTWDEHLSRKARIRDWSHYSWNNFYGLATPASSLINVCQKLGGSLLSEKKKKKTLWEIMLLMNSRNKQEEKLKRRMVERRIKGSHEN